MDQKPIRDFIEALKDLDESLKETEAILKDPRLIEALQQSEIEDVMGMGIPWEEAKRQLGLSDEDSYEAT